MPYLLPPHLLPPRLLLLHLRPRARRSAAQAQVFHLRFILCAPVPGCFTLRQLVPHLLPPHLLPPRLLLLHLRPRAR